MIEMKRSKPHQSRRGSEPISVNDVFDSDAQISEYNQQHHFPLCFLSTEQGAKPRSKKNYIEPFTHLTTAGLANDTGRGRKEPEVFYTAHDSRLGEVQMHKELRCQPFGPPGKKRKENVRILDLLEFPLSHLSRNANS